jgi:signal transduction histidine kinase
VPADDGPGELRSLAATFNAMLGRLGRSAEDRERALAATRRFAADAGHELRTPLTSLQATLSSLRRHPDVPADRRGELLDDALGEHRRIVVLLDGLQALARGDAQAVEHAPVDLAELVGAAAGETGRRHDGARVEAVLPGLPVVVDGWEPGLRLLVENLLENAARHGRPAGRSARRSTTTAARRCSTSTTTGPGSPAADRRRVFEPFVRVHGEERPGSGLGLALVAQQARHHGAAVGVTESPLGGARVTVRFTATPH